MTEKENPTRILMFVRRCTVSKGKEGRMFYEITEDELHAGEFDERNFDGESRERTYGNSKQIRSYMSGSPGMAYRVEYDSDNPSTIFSSTSEYIGTWPDQIKRAEWQMLDQTEAQRINLIKVEKKAKRDDAILECLRPIREAYFNSIGTQKNLIIARAVQYITRR